MSATSAAINQFPCVNCGANTSFGPGTGALLCEHCGHAEPVETSNTPIVEIDFFATLRQVTAMPATATAAAGTEIQCKNCGARTMSAKHAVRCAFCDSAMVIELPPEPMQVPQAVLPFETKRDTAQELFVGWLKSRWFAPFKLVERAKRDGLDGVYLPYWTYDTSTVTDYQGERGDYYYVTVTYKDGNGKEQTKQERRTRWSDSSGTVQVPFDDVLVCSSTSLPTRLLHDLEPWDLGRLAPFNAKYLAGFMAERQRLPLREGFDEAKIRMEPKINQEICRDIGGDEQRISSKNVDYREVTWKHILLPLWLSAFHYNNKVFRVTVNARTGEVSGERPYSAVKIIMFILMICAIIGGIVYLVIRNKNGG
ncbi:MAG: hypothetical protein KBG15_02160 [Kofleriaceae bacterium]|nr:hypothetical protein [Kofleriaceae bacterium]